MLEQTRPDGHGRARGLVSSRVSGKRVEAATFAPSSALAEVVETYWMTRWNLDGQAPHVAELITDIRRQQERSGRLQLQDLAMMVAEIAQVLGQARALAREVSDLVEQAPSDLTTDDATRLYELVADLQRQIDELKASDDAHLDESDQQATTASPT